jgi:hypothetical protein
MNTKRKITDWLMLIVVALVAIVIISLSFKHTSEIAKMLSLPPVGTAFIVEVLFASLLFLRARQLALKLNVPFFLTFGYFVSFIFVTGTNVYGLSLKNPILGPIFGFAISGFMWLMESVLVWLWTDSLKPYKKSLRDLKRETMKEIKEAKEIQRLEWMKYEAKQPDLKLILEARKAEEKRKKILGDGLPEFFLEMQKRDPIKEIVADLEESEPKVIDVPEQEQQNQSLPVVTKRVFQESQPAPAFQPNEEKRKQAIETAKKLKENLGRTPTKGELIGQGLTDHYSRLALKILKKETG